MKRKLLFLVLVLASASNCWNGQRQGFLLGIGGGAGALLSQSLSSPNPLNVPVFKAGLGAGINQNVAVELTYSALFARNTTYQYLGIQSILWGDSQGELPDRFTLGMGMLAQGLDFEAAGVGWDAGYHLGMTEHLSLGLDGVLGLLIRGGEMTPDRTWVHQGPNFFGSLALSVDWLCY